MLLGRGREGRRKGSRKGENKGGKEGGKDRERREREERGGGQLLD